MCGRKPKGSGLNRSVGKNTEIIRHRVQRACEQCRVRKTKCSGEKPGCFQCKELNLECIYTDDKRQRIKNELVELRGKVSKYEKIINDMLPNLSSTEQAKVKDILGPNSFLGNLNYSKNDPVDQDEKNVSAEVGSVSSMDETDFDFESKGKEIRKGLLGKPSNEVWIRRTIEDISGKEEAKKKTEPIYLDDINVRGFSTFEQDQIDYDTLFELPSKETSDYLINLYFNSLHPVYRIFSRTFFLNQYSIFWDTIINNTFDVKNYDNNKQLSAVKIDRGWLAVLNGMYSISTVRDMVEKQQYKGNEPDHFRFFNKAMHLGINISTPGSISQVQRLMLCSFYLLTTGRINWAYNLIGLAIRIACSIGLHLKAKSNSFTQEENKTRVFIWNTLLNMETHVCFISGRPPSIKREQTTSPLPYRINDDIYFDLFYQESKISRIASDCLENIYFSSVKMVNWFSVERSIDHLNNELLKWKNDLPESCSFNDNKGFYQFKENSLFGAYLAIEYNIVICLINRPCLCIIDIEKESEKSKKFKIDSANRCLKAAQDIITYLPAGSEILFHLDHIPWWNIPNIILSAVSVMLLGIYLCPTAECYKKNGNSSVLDNYNEKTTLPLQSVTEQSSTACAVINKAFSILEALGPNNISAKRCTNALLHLDALVNAQVHKKFFGNDMDNNNNNSYNNNNNDDDDDDNDNDNKKINNNNSNNNKNNSANSNNNSDSTNSFQDCSNNPPQLSSNSQLNNSSLQYNGFQQYNHINTQQESNLRQSHLQQSGEKSVPLNNHDFNCLQQIPHQGVNYENVTNNNDQKVKHYSNLQLQNTDHRVIGHQQWGQNEFYSQEPNQEQWTVPNPNVLIYNQTNPSQISSIPRNETNYNLPTPIEIDNSDNGHNITFSNSITTPENYIHLYNHGNGHNNNNHINFPSNIQFNEQYNSLNVSFHTNREQHTTDGSIMYDDHIFSRNQIKQERTNSFPKEDNFEANEANEYDNDDDDDDDDDEEEDEEEERTETVSVTGTRAGLGTRTGSVTITDQVCQVTSSTPGSVTITDQVGQVASSTPGPERVQVNSGWNNPTPAHQVSNALNFNSYDFVSKPFYFSSMLDFQGQSFPNEDISKEGPNYKHFHFLSRSVESSQTNQNQNVNIDFDYINDSGENQK